MITKTQYLFSVDWRGVMTRGSMRLFKTLQEVVDHTFDPRHSENMGNASFFVVYKFEGDNPPKNVTRDVKAMRRARIEQEKKVS